MAGLLNSMVTSFSESGLYKDFFSHLPEGLNNAYLDFVLVMILSAVAALSLKEFIMSLLWRVRNKQRQEELRNMQIAKEERERLEREEYAAFIRWCQMQRIIPGQGMSFEQWKIMQEEQNKPVEIPEHVTEVKGPDVQPELTARPEPLDDKAISGSEGSTPKPKDPPRSELVDDIEDEKIYDLNDIDVKKMDEVKEIKTPIPVKKEPEEKKEEIDITEIINRKLNSAKEENTNTEENKLKAAMARKQNQMSLHDFASQLEEKNREIKAKNMEKLQSAMESELKVEGNEKKYTDTRQQRRKEQALKFAKEQALSESQGK